MGKVDLIGVADADDRMAGAIVVWRLEGSASAKVLRDEWERRGLPEALLPNPPDASTVLRRATGSVYPAARCIEPLRIESDPAFVCGYTVFERSVTDGRAEIEPIADTFLRCEGGAYSVSVSDTTGDDEKLTAALAAAYEREAAHLTSNDVSKFVVRLVDYCKAVAIKDKGGVYFVPRQTIKTWREFVSALETTTQHRFFSYPAMQSKDAVEAVLDALVSDTSAALYNIEVALERRVGDDGEVHTRMKNARERQLVGVESKLSMYEELLGTRLSDVRERIATVRARLTGSALVEIDVEV